MMVAERLLDHGREEISRADAKASMLVSAATAIVVVVLLDGVGGLPGRFGVVAGSLPWLGCAVWIAGMVLLVLAVFPRLGSSSDDGQVTFFAHVNHLESPSSLRRSVVGAGRDPLMWVLAKLRT